MSNIILDPKAPQINKVNVPIDKIGHGKFSFIDRDVKGKIIDARAGFHKAVEVEGDSRFCGHRFILASKLYGDKRCLYCGTWFHWKDTDYQSWIKTGNVDRMNIDDTIEPLHCGSEHCQDYHHLCVQSEETRLKRQDRQGYELYKYMQGQGLVD